MSETLQQLDVGDAGRVVGFAPGEKTYRRRLLAMGLTPGTAFAVTRQAPMGDPVELRVRGFSLSLRREEAAALHIERRQA